MNEIEKKQELRMWLAVRRDIHIPKPKFGAQAGHGFVEAILVAMEKDPGLVAAYRAADQPKITVWAKNADELVKLHALCEEAGIPSALITDAGRTVFPEPTMTVLGIGPCLFADLPKRVQRLQLMKEQTEDSVVET